MYVTYIDQLNLRVKLPIIDSANLIVLSGTPTFFQGQINRDKVVSRSRLVSLYNSLLQCTQVSVLILQLVCPHAQHGWHLSWGPVSWRSCRGLWELSRMEHAMEDHHAVHLFGWIKELRSEVWKTWWVILAKEQWWKATRFLNQFL